MFMSSVPAEEPEKADDDKAETAADVSWQIIQCFFYSLTFVFVF